MKETGLLMTTENVGRILSGHKTQTRRIIKNQPTSWERPQPCSSTTREGFQGPIDRSLWSANGTDTEDEEPRRCPYGGPGDRIWIRENHFRYGHWEPVSGGLTKGGRQKWQFVADSDNIMFDYVGEDRVCRPAPDIAPISFFYRRLGRFMPRSACRLLLGVADVRPERLRSITGADAIAEGIVHRGEEWRDYTNALGVMLSPRSSFKTLWQSINGMDSWEPDPWVWVIRFRVLEAG